MFLHLVELQRPPLHSPSFQFSALHLEEKHICINNNQIYTLTV